MPPAAEEPAQTLPPFLLLLISFLGGFQIMVLEIGGFRLLQTNLGSSVIVTGTLLTMVMVLLSAGYYSGGRLSNIFSSFHTLVIILICSTFYAHLVNVLLVDSITSAGFSLRNILLSSYFLMSIIPSIFLVTILYGPPVFAMSMISPFLIRFYTTNARKDSVDAGRQAGFFMSLSTIGSIIGTLLSSYLLVPFFGVTTAVVVTNTFFLAVLLLSLFLSGNVSKKSALLISTLTLSYGASFILLFNKPGDPSVIYDKESYYGNIQILKTTDHSQRTVLEYRPSKVVVHSLLYPDEPLRDIVGLVYLLPATLHSPKNILVLGSAAGSAIRQIELVFPHAKITGVDIDSQIHQVAQDIFKVNTAKSRLLSRDARVYLSETSEVYDFIILDVFSGEFIPLQCITLEFFTLLKSRLSPTGMIYINTNMNDIDFDLPDDLDPFRPIRHLLVTLKSAGFKSIFENRFFHSLYVYPNDVNLTQIRTDLLRQFSNQNLHEPVRGTAGLITYTTIDVSMPRNGYRTFTDTWTPGFLIELKTNEQQIYAALQKYVDTIEVFERENGSETHRLVSKLVLEQIFEDSQEFGYLISWVRGHRKLIERLENIKAPFRESDIEWAARFFRFAHSAEDSKDMTVNSQWAKVAAIYMKMYRNALDNDYESLLLTVNSLTDYINLNPKE
jgi:predicted membrane-bound spermidine synthase